MRSQVAMWGNSLAVRISADCARVAGLRAGNNVDLGITKASEIRLAPARAFDKTAFLARLAKLHREMPMTKPVVEAMRKAARY